MNTAFNNNYSVLPFYESTDMQLRNLTYSYGAIYPLFCQKDMYPCFQLVLPSGSQQPVIQDGGTRKINLYLMDKANNQVKLLSISPDLHVSSLSVNGETRYVIWQAGETVHTAEHYILPLGQYYIKLEDLTNNLTYYSDFITVVDSVADYLKIEWRDYDNLIGDSAIILYKSGNLTYRNVVYLPTQLGKPEYQFDEEGETRDGHFFPTKQVSYKRYKASFEACEYLLDVMRLIRLSDVVVVTDPYGTQFQADTLLITPQWTDQGDLATCTMEMTSNTVVKRCGRAIS